MNKPFWQTFAKGAKLNIVATKIKQLLEVLRDDFYDVEIPSTNQTLQWLKNIHQVFETEYDQDDAQFILKWER